MVCGYSVCRVGVGWWGVCGYTKGKTRGLLFLTVWFFEKPKTFVNKDVFTCVPGPPEKVHIHLRIFC